MKKVLLILIPIVVVVAVGVVIFSLINQRKINKREAANKAAGME